VLVLNVGRNRAIGDPNGSIASLRVPARHQSGRQRRVAGIVGVDLTEAPFQDPPILRPRQLRQRMIQCRRIATHYDKRAANYLTFIKLAAIRICVL
jgi:transposase